MTIKVMMMMIVLILMMMMMLKMTKKANNNSNNNDLGVTVSAARSAANTGLCVCFQTSQFLMKRPRASSTAGWVATLTWPASPTATPSLRSPGPRMDWTSAWTQATRWRWRVTVNHPGLSATLLWVDLRVGEGVMRDCQLPYCEWIWGLVRVWWGTVSYLIVSGSEGWWGSDEGLWATLLWVDLRVGEGLMRDCQLPYCEWIWGLVRVWWLSGTLLWVDLRVGEGLMRDCQLPYCEWIWGLVRVWWLSGTLLWVDLRVGEGLMRDCYVPHCE